MEYARTTNGLGEVFKWIDGTLHAVMDTVTGELYRLEGGDSIGTLSQCLDLVKQSHAWAGRLIIIKIDCIRAFELKRTAQQGDK